MFQVCGEVEENLLPREAPGPEAAEGLGPVLGLVGGAGGPSEGCGPLREVSYILCVV